MKLSPEITDEFIQKTTAPGKQYCAFLYKAVPYHAPRSWWTGGSSQRIRVDTVRGGRAAR